MNWNWNWSSWSDFAAMGGYGGFVWGSFGVTALVVLVECVALRARRRAVANAFEDAFEERAPDEGPMQELTR